MAIFADVVDFPTPPLPDPMATNLLTLLSRTFSTFSSFSESNVEVFYLFS